MPYQLPLIVHYLRRLTIAPDPHELALRSLTRFPAPRVACPCVDLTVTRQSSFLNHTGTKPTGIDAIACLLMTCTARMVNSRENRTQSSRFPHRREVRDGRRGSCPGSMRDLRERTWRRFAVHAPFHDPESGAIDKRLHLWITHAPQVEPGSSRPRMGIDAGRGETVGPVFRHRPRSRMGSARPARAERRRSHGGGLMRSFDWLSVLQALARIGRWFERARQSLLARSPLVRWSFAAVVVFDSDPCRLPGNRVARTGRQFLPRFGPAVLTGRSGQGPPCARTPAHRLPNRRRAAGRGVGRRVRGRVGGDRQARARAPITGRSSRSVGRFQRV